MDKNKLIFPITILLASIILGGFYYASEVNKQKSIERQQQIDLQVKTEADRVKAEQERIKIEKDNANEIFTNNLKCQTLLKDLKERWNNVIGIYYRGVTKNIFERQNTCIVKFTEKGEVKESAIEDMQDVK